MVDRREVSVAVVMGPSSGPRCGGAGAGGAVGDNSNWNQMMATKVEKRRSATVVRDLPGPRKEIIILRKSRCGRGVGEA